MMERRRHGGLYRRRLARAVSALDDANAGCSRQPAGRRRYEIGKGLRAIVPRDREGHDGESGYKAAKKEAASAAEVFGEATTCVSQFQAGW